MAKVFYKHGNAAVGVSDELERLVNQLLDANPIIKRTMADAVEEIYQDAYREWPVRVDPPKGIKGKMMTEMSRLKKSGKSSSQAYAIAKSMQDRGKFVPCCGQSAVCTRLFATSFSVRKPVYLLRVSAKHLYGVGFFE